MGRLRCKRPRRTLWPGLDSRRSCKRSIWICRGRGRCRELDQVVVRVTQSILPFEVGANQPDAATRTGQADSVWQNMTQVEAPYGTEQPLQPFDMVTGDIYAIPFDQLGNDKGQLAIQQTKPIPLTVRAAMPWVRVMDDADV